MYWVVCIGWYVLGGMYWVVCIGWYVLGGMYWVVGDEQQVSRAERPQSRVTRTMPSDSLRELPAPRRQPLQSVAPTYLEVGSEVFKGIAQLSHSRSSL